MNDRAPLFDYAEGLRRKEKGIDTAAENRRTLLKHARAVAEEIAMSKPDRTVTADDVAERLDAEGISVHALGNAAGALFQGDRWIWTGRRIKSRRPHAHANELKVWRLNR